MLHRGVGDWSGLEFYATLTSCGIGYRVEKSGCRGMVFRREHKIQASWAGAGVNPQSPWRRTLLADFPDETLTLTCEDLRTLTVLRAAGTSSANNCVLVWIQSTVKFTSYLTLKES